jgi:uncharacterized protein (DUF4213/DUF364 family)
MSICPLKISPDSLEMKIIDDLLSSLSYEAGVRDIRLGPFQTAVLTRYCGLASSPHKEGHSHHHGQAPVAEAGLLISRSALELARMAYSESQYEAVIGMATINSLIEVDEARCVEINAADLLIEKGRGKKVALIGHFPFVLRLGQAAGKLWVIEKNPRQGDFSADEAERLLPQADVIGITGTAFTNHTIGPLLNLCPSEAYIVLLGGTAPLSPVLFDHKVNAVSGTRVVDPQAVLNYVSQGATFRQIKGLRLLTMMR